MTKTILSALALASSLGVAHAQSVETNQQRLHDGRVAHIAGGSAGTVGAMEAYTYGLPTSPQDVALQQSGRAVNAEGGRQMNAVESVGYAHGTVGAAPGQ